MEYKGFIEGTGTGKSLSEAFILGSTNPQYDKRLFIDLPVHYLHENYKLRTWGEHVAYINYSECQNINKKQFVCTTCSKLGIFLCWIGNLMNNLLSCCGLVDTKIRASDKDLPV